MAMAESSVSPRTGHLLGGAGGSPRCHPGPHGAAPRLLPLRGSCEVSAASENICPNMAVTMVTPLPASPDKNGSVRAGGCAPGAGILSPEPPHSRGTQQPSHGHCILAERVLSPSPCFQHTQTWSSHLWSAAQPRGTMEGTGQHRKTRTVGVKTRSWAPGCLWVLNWACFHLNWGFTLLPWRRAWDKSEDSGQKLEKPRSPWAQGCESAGHIPCPASPAAQAGSRCGGRSGALILSSSHLPVSHLAEETADGTGDTEVAAAPAPRARGTRRLRCVGHSRALPHSPAARSAPRPPCLQGDTSRLWCWQCPSVPGACRPPLRALLLPGSPPTMRPALC